MSAKEKKVLGALYLLDLGIASARKSKHTRLDLAKVLGVTEKELEADLHSLEKDHDLEVKGDIAKLTEKGRRKITVVMAGGAFDIIHPGHIDTLSQAKKLGDVLVVSIARDSTFEKNKGRTPVHNERLRRYLVSAIKPVDAAILGSKKNIFETVEFLKPDIIALGYDQLHSARAINKEAKRANIKLKVVRLGSSNPAIKTTNILFKGKKW
ncbi:MAG: adenylyltransferase/cytidyltransferase family protein [Nitrososphaerales archaeon]